MKLHHLVLTSLAVLWTWILPVNTKTIKGVFTSSDAQYYHGQYVTSFCFHGENAEIRYRLNTTTKAKTRLYIFLDEDWDEARYTNDCFTKLQLARIIHSVNSSSGNVTLAHFPRPRIWHVVFGDLYTCDQADPAVALDKGNYIQYEMQLLNPDVLGNPTDHFGDDETGLFRFYQLLTLGYFVISCIYGPSLWEALHKQGPMHLVIQLLTGAMLLQGLGALLMVFHLRGYSKNGVGTPFFEFLAELLDLVSQFFMLFTMLSLCSGFNLAGTSKTAKSLSTLKDKPVAKLVATFAVVQALLFIWEQYEEKQYRMYHAHRTIAGMALALARTILAGVLAYNVYSTTALERSKLKKDFYAQFIKSCLLWFLSYPVLVFVSWLFSPYLRFKFVTMSVVLCQCLAVMMLYRLFLSRSLYWEVSALSSTLPLRMDKSFGRKVYS